MFCLSGCLFHTDDEGNSPTLAFASMSQMQENRAGTCCSRILSVSAHHSRTLSTWYVWQSRACALKRKIMPATVYAFIRRRLWSACSTKAASWPLRKLFAIQISSPPCPLLVAGAANVWYTATSHPFGARPLVSCRPIIVRPWDSNCGAWSRRLTADS